MFSQGFSGDDQLGLEQSGSIGLNHLTPFHIQQIQAEIQLQHQQHMAAMAASSIQNQKLRQLQQQQTTLSFLSPKAIPMKYVGSHVGGKFGDYKPLHSSVDAKLQAICQSLADPEKRGNLGKPVSDSKKTIDGRSQRGLTVPIPSQPIGVLENSSKGELGFLGSEDCKVEISSSPSLSDSDESAGSSPESDIKFLNFYEPPWNESENFLLQKFPSLEIDWEAIMS
ncbi:hypothetical protein HHK36_004040 [Tetracentron sinense]|uniref:Uncharacterized protein n=1 Tax=Tetracentron sinense TaxID=13715 RepID=A0A834ZUH3_TETSI|nr:hypothetical protein HHK36_004040 [Tetracentron sinense]